MEVDEEKGIRISFYFNRQLTKTLKIIADRCDNDTVIKIVNNEKESRFHCG